MVLSRKLLLICMVFAGVWALPVAAFAQDTPMLGKTYVTANGAFSVDYPDTWQATTFSETPNEPSFIILSNDEVTLKNFENRPGTVLVAVFPPGTMQFLLAEEDANPRTPRELVDLFMKDTDDSTTFGEVEELAVGELRAAQVSVKDDEAEGVLIVADLDDGDLAAVIGFTLPGQFAPHKVTVQAIAASMKLIRPEPLEVPELTETYTATEFGFTFNYPETWVVDDKDSPGPRLATSQTTLDRSTPGSGEAAAIFITTEYLSAEFGEPFGATAGEVAAQILLALTGEEETDVTMSRVVPLTIGDYEAARANLNTPDTQGMILVLDLGNGQLIVMLAAAYPGELSRYEPIFLAIAETIQPLAREEQE